MTMQSNTTVEKPSHRIYAVSGKGKSANWTPIGAAWPNRDGQGFSITYDAFPKPDSRIIMRTIKERASQGEGQ